MTPLALLGLKAVGVGAVLLAVTLGVNALDKSRQQIGYDRRVAEDNAALVKAQDEARETERELRAKLEGARNEAAKRAQDSRRAAAAAADAGERLRIALDTIRKGLSGHPGAASADATHALATVLGECADKYRHLAEAADGHANDARTLIEGWPRAMRGTLPPSAAPPH